MGDLAGENSFSAIDEGERRLTSGLCRRGADGTEHRRELIDPVLSYTPFELVLLPHRGLGFQLLLFTIMIGRAHV